MENNEKTFQYGLSLVEVLTAFAIFGILSVSLMAIFTASVNTQTVILQNQAIMNETNFVLDYIGRAVRLAKYDDIGACTGGTGLNYGISGNTITFLSWDSTKSDYVCRSFGLSNNAIVERFSTDGGSANLQSAISLTSGQVKVENLSFNATGNSRSDTLQPKVAINFKMTPTGRRIEPVPEIIIQTSISQRNLDID